MILVFSMAFNGIILAAVSVKGYYKKNGTYIAPHYRSSPNNSKLNNKFYPQTSYPKSLNNWIDNSSGSTNTLKIYKWTDKKGVTHFSDKKNNQ